MENPFSAVAIAATVEVIVDTKEQVSYQTTKMQREIILTKLKEKGCRITKQRLRLIDIILQNEWKMPVPLSWMMVRYIISQQKNGIP